MNFKSILSSFSGNKPPQFQSVEQSKVSMGAGAAEGEAIVALETALNWITDSKKKMMTATPALRIEAFQTDPLMNGIIAPFLKNTLLSGYSIETEDNAKYEPMIKEMREYLDGLQYMAVLRDNFNEYMFTRGAMFLRKDEEQGKVTRLQKLEAHGMKKYEDPWKSNVFAYHQKVNVKDGFSDTATETEYNSWFIPDGKQYIPDSSIGLDEPAATWAAFKKKYNIMDVNNLRVDDVNKVIALYRYTEGDPAPIDNAILAIWLKRLLLSNSPNVILSVIYPFLQVKFGRQDLASAEGMPTYISTIPKSPPSSMATTDPEQYAAMTADVDAYNAAVKKATGDLIRYRQEGGIYGCRPDVEMQVHESGRSISPTFLKELLRTLNEEIGQAVGFPVALISAQGSELATSRTIKEMFDGVYVGERQDFERAGTQLLKERFEGESWTYSITDISGNEETGTFTYEEANPQFKLSTGDVSNELQEAQIRLVNMQTLEVAKKVGASKDDVRALGDEQGFGLLDLDEFDNVQDGGGGFGGFSTASIEPELKPENTPQDTQLEKDLMAAYKTAQKAMDDALKPASKQHESIDKLTELQLQIARTKLEVLESMKDKV